MRFSASSADLVARAVPILDALAATLAANPDLAVLQIRACGGGDATLASQRADAVRNELERRGIARDRLATDATADVCEQQDGADIGVTLRLTDQPNC